ncbi:MAG: hypothetical protein L6Q29_04605 [Candidatus Pacebacteria bacterium]|nr:hypothetical protein [Candidatus Paceibacterota bacterium]MCK6623434.1 hypothetical protein [Calditrichia bacterium]NUQ44160.1 hypothetical protein [Calditrichaceae bacterium]
MKDHKQRIEYLRKALKVANEDTTNQNIYTIKNWKGKPLHKKVISVDIDYLMFRIDNSRTEIQQLRYLRENPTLPKSLFDDPESSKAQDAQEFILIEMIKAKGKDFLEDLRLRGQDEAAIVTYDGYLVNGNRRVAALRFLGERYIDCVILPEDATPRDIYALEQELQISQDFKEEYHWINELTNIRRGLVDKRYAYKEIEIAKRLRMNVSEIKTKMRMLELIDSFLNWKNISKQYDYSKLDEAEQIFIQLEKAIKKYKNDEKKMNELKNAVFHLIEEKPSKGRLYGYVMDLIRNFDQVYSRMTVALTPQNYSKSLEDQQQVINGNILDTILEGEVVDKHEIFGDSKEAAKISSILVEKIADIKAEYKEKKNAEAVYESVSTALRELQGLVIDNDTAKIESIESKLNQIIYVANDLLKQVKLLQ